MIALKSLLLHLSRPEVTEVALASERNPCARAGGAYEPICADVLSTEDILQVLFNAGGSRHVDSLNPKPTQWTARIEGLPPVAVSAVMHGEAVHARFTLRQRDTQAPGAPTQRPSQPADRAATPARRPTPGPTAAISFELDDVEDRPPLVPPPRPATVAPVAPRGTPIGRVSPLLPGEPKPPSSRRSRPTGKARSAPPPPSSRRPSRSSAPMRPAPPPTHDRLFQELLGSARAAGASDLHLVAGRPPLLRVAGKLSPQGDPLEPRRCEEMLLARVPVRLAPVLAREGSVDFSLEEPGFGRFRVNIGRQRTGLKASLRLIPAEIPTLASLGLPEAIGQAAHHHQGLVVLTGPTGHGKTATLAAIVDILNRETARHIITVEDPVEYLHPRKKAMMSQREVGTHTRSFQAALKASLREDPDVIVVGELRDTETVRMALSASETGHLVLGTMNTPSAAKTIDRIIDLFPPGDQQQVRVTLAGGLRLVVSQRLVPSPDELRMTAAAEVLPGSVPLWNLIRDSKTYQIPSLQQRGKGIGVVRLDDSLADLVRSGRASLASALAVAEQPDEFEAAFAGRRSAVPQGDRERGSPTHVEESPDRLSDPFGEVAPPPVPPAATGAKALLERAGALFGKRGG